MVAYIDRLFSKPSTKGRYIYNCNMVKCPKQIFVKSNRTLLNSNLNAISH